MISEELLEGECALEDSAVEYVNTYLDCLLLAWSFNGRIQLTYDFFIFNLHLRDFL